MARAKVVHSEDSCLIKFEGDKSKPEPSQAVIEFPGGFVEVTRCSDGTYWAHVGKHEQGTIVGSRVDYNLEGSRELGIPDIPQQEKLVKLAMRIAVS